MLGPVFLARSTLCQVEVVVEAKFGWPRVDGVVVLYERSALRRQVREVVPAAACCDSRKRDTCYSICLQTHSDDPPFFYSAKNKNQEN